MTTPTPNPSSSGEPLRVPRTVTPMSVPALNYDRLRFPLTHDQLASLVRAGLEEDQAFNDVTTIATVLSSRRARASLVARQSGCIAGVPLALEAFRMLDQKISMRVDAEDGTRLEKGDTVIYMTGHARALLSAERTALNFMQRLSGIATLTAKFVDAVKGTKAKILDTRKTTPGWRKLEKYAVRAGGGVNHRLDLARAVLIKDNHLKAVDGDGYKEPLRVSGVVAGSAMAQAWSLKPEAHPADFYFAKGVVEDLCAALGISTLTFTPSTHPLTHSGRTAEVRSGDG